MIYCKKQIFIIYSNDLCLVAGYYVLIALLVNFITLIFHYYFLKFFNLQDHLHLNEVIVNLF